MYLTPIFRVHLAIPHPSFIIGYFNKWSIQRKNFLPSLNIKISAYINTVKSFASMALNIRIVVNFQPMCINQNFFVVNFKLKLRVQSRKQRESLLSCKGRRQWQEQRQIRACKDTGFSVSVNGCALKTMAHPFTFSNLII